MSDPRIDTVLLQRFVERWQGGDNRAVDELMRTVGDRLEHLTRKMLRGFPNVRPWAETGDVLQESLFRLLNTLRKVQPESTRHFFNLAALHIRRELLDLARRCASRPQVQQGTLENSGESLADGLAQIPDQVASSAEDLELWCRLHEAVDQLPAEEREVVGQLFYHGWTQVQIAELFQMDERTIRRRWQSACLKLNQLLGGQLPPL